MRRNTNYFLTQKNNQLQKEMQQLNQLSKQLLGKYQDTKFSGGLVFFNTKDEQKIASTYHVLNNTFPNLKQQAKELLIQLETTDKMLRRSYNLKNSFSNKRILDEATIRSLKKKLNEVIQSCEYCHRGTQESANKSLLTIDFQPKNAGTPSTPSPSGVPIPYPNFGTVPKNKESFQNHFGLNSNYASILLNAHLLMSSIQKSKTTLRTLNKL